MGACLDGIVSIRSARDSEGDPLVWHFSQPLAPRASGALPSKVWAFWLLYLLYTPHPPVLESGTASVVYIGSASHSDSPCSVC